MIFRSTCDHYWLTVALSATLLLGIPVAWSQTSRSLEWHADQQPASVPCTSEDMAFVNAPEQALLERSYVLQPSFPLWKCESIDAPALNGSRVLIVFRPSVIDDGEAYALIQPKGSTNVRLLPLIGGLQPLTIEDDWHARAAMNAILQTANYDRPETIDWLALCLAYLTILDDAPNLEDRHYSPGPSGPYFKPYTVPGFLRELPALASKHLSPTLTCDGSSYCTVHFFYRTEPVEPLKMADFVFRLQDGTLSLLQAEVKEYPPEGGKKLRPTLK